MKRNKVFEFKKKPLNKTNLLLDDDILYEKNGFEELDDAEMSQYLLERYGVAAMALMYGYVSPKQIKKANKKAYKEKGKNKSFRKNKHKNIYDFDENTNIYDVGLEEKTIYYYRDINQPDDVEIFDNLHDFDNFLSEEGIEIGDDEVNKLMSRDISHCCLNPIDRFNKNRLRIMSSSSYGDLRFSNAELEYDCC